MHLKIYLTLNEKSIIIKTVNRVCKRCQNIFIGLKKTCLGCFRIEEIRDKDNEIDLKEGGGIEIESTVLSIYAIASLSLCITYHHFLIHRFLNF